MFYEEEKKSSISSFTEDIKDAFKTATSFDGYVDTFQKLQAYATNLNETFLQTRGRIVEMGKSIADAVPGVTRLGGDIRDVQSTISAIALASNRNVIANSESVEKLYASTKLLGQGADDLTSAFLDAGVSFEKIPKMLEDSIYYVQSVGQNAREVMKKVVDNTDQLNRFSFEGGVKGLTKMAAQASLLRMDMNDTFQLADRLLDPESAVEMASAFQRLGVSAGNLTDPFQLMNQSINDPSGLQDSLANVAKGFVSFNQETKSFDLSRNGVLVLRQMEKDAGLAAGSLSKAGLAAADLDRRVSQIEVAGLKFKNEEDKQYLANIATMNKGGTYEVKLQDGTTKELRQLNQEEFDKLIEQQKTGPKTMEELLRDTFNVNEILSNDVAAIKEKILYGLVSPAPILQTGERYRQAATSISSALSTDLTGDVQTIRKKGEDIIQTVGDKVRDILSKQGAGTNQQQSLTTVMSEAQKTLGDQLELIKSGSFNFVGDLLNKLSQAGFGDISQYLGNFAPPPPQAVGASANPISLSGLGSGTNTGLPTIPTGTQQFSIEHQFQKLMIELTTPAGVDPTQMKKFFDDTFNEARFQTYAKALWDAIQNNKPMPKY